MKKVFSTIAIISVLSASVFAQNYKPTSKTRSSTSYVFSNDVDNFIDVTNWSKVKPANFFGLLGYDGNNGLQLGAAKNFKPGYMAFYLDGNLGWNFTDTSSTTYVGDTTTKTSTDSGNTSDFTFSYLFGTEKQSFKAGFLYDGNTADTKTKTDGNVISNVNRYTFSPYFMYGTTAESKGYKLTPYAGVYYEAYANKSKTVTETAVATTTTISDTSTRYLGIIGGTGIDLGKKEKLSQSANVSARLEFGMYPKKSASSSSDTGTSSSTENSGRKYVYSNIAGSYRAEYAATDKLTLGARINSSITGSTRNPNKVQTIIVSDTKTETKQAYTKTTALSFSNSVNLGAEYAVNKTVQLNAGAQLTLPSISYNGTTSYDADHEKTGKSGTWTGTSSSCALNLSSGAAFNFGNVVTLDVSTQLLNNVLSNTLNSKWDDDFWTNVNTVAFPSLDIALSVKF